MINILRVKAPPPQPPPTPLACFIFQTASFVSGVNENVGVHVCVVEMNQRTEGALPPPLALIRSELWAICLRMVATFAHTFPPLLP